MRVQWTTRSLVAGVLFVAAKATAAGFPFGTQLQQSLEGFDLQTEADLDLRAIGILPARNAFALTSTQDLVRESLAEKGLHPFIRVNRKRDAFPESQQLQLGSRATQGSVITNYELTISGYPLCGVDVRSVQHPSGAVALVGKVPYVGHVGQYGDQDWPDATESARHAIEEIAKHQNADIAGSRVTSAKRCLFNTPSGLEPAWDFILYVNGLQYGAQATPWEVMAGQQRYFDATATVRAYSPNVSSGTLKDFSITVNGDGTLTNTYFTTSDYYGATRAYSASNSFVYSGTSESRFAEASTFVYANQQYDFAFTNGYVWSGAKPLTIISHALIKGTTNNALYTPYDNVSGPYITVGDGDGSANGLQNLAYDSDVTSHEFGHHIVYQTVNDIRSEALIIHEGLADFLTFSRTGDACLGESICPTGSGMCLADRSCLRSAENTITYNDATYKSSKAHLQGQLVSGVLWDMRKNAAIPSDTLTRYVFDAIKYLPAAASMKSLIAAVLYVDSLNSSTYQSAIQSAASARGLGIDVLGIDMSNLQGSLTSTTSSSGGSSSSSSGGGFFGCSTIAGDADPSAYSSLLFVILALVPFVVIWSSKFQRVAVPVRKHNDRNDK